MVDQNDNNVGELILTLILTPLEKDGRMGGTSTDAHITDSTPVTITEGLLKIKKIVVMDVVGKELLGGKDALYVRVGVDDWQVVLPLNCGYFLTLFLTLFSTLFYTPILTFFLPLLSHIHLHTLSYFPFSMPDTSPLITCINTTPYHDHYLYLYPCPTL